MCLSSSKTMHQHIAVMTWSTAVHSLIVICGQPTLLTIWPKYSWLPYLVTRLSDIQVAIRHNIWLFLKPSTLVAKHCNFDQVIENEICTFGISQRIHRVSEKTVQISFWQNFVKFPPILVMFGRKIAKRLKLCEVHSFSTSSNSHHHTTVLINADVPNCYTMLKVVICNNKLSNDLISTQ